MYVLTVTETLEDWEDSVNIGKVLLHVLPLSINTCGFECCCLHHTLYFLFMWRLEYCTETTLAVTTGAYKSRPLIITAVVLSCSTVYYSCQCGGRQYPVCVIQSLMYPLCSCFELWKPCIRQFGLYMHIWRFSGIYIYIWVSRYYRYRWILYLHPTLMHLIKNASLPHCDILWNVSIQCHCFLFFFF